MSGTVYVDTPTGRMCIGDDGGPMPRELAILVAEDFYRAMLDPALKALVDIKQGRPRTGVASMPVDFHLEEIEHALLSLVHIQQGRVRVGRNPSPAT